MLIEKTKFCLAIHRNKSKKILYNRNQEKPTMYESKLKSDLIDQLFNVILTLKDIESCYRFFEDVCTVQELQDLATRFEVARLLHQQHSYADIIKLTKASSATISRVNRALMYGADGYQQALKKLTK
jgi:TrpR-related protein YerC/YecD